MGSMVQAMAVDSGGKPESTVWGWGRRVPLAQAVFANAIFGRCRELDDVHEGSPLIGFGHGGHVSVMVVPAVLAAAEASGEPVSGAELLTAIAVGADIIARIRMAAGRNGRLGFEGPSIAPFGVAAALCRLWRFDEETTANAWGAAYSQCCGNVQGTADGSWDVWLNAGLGARGGVWAADLARHGHQGTRAPLTGRAGLYPLYFRGEYHEAALLKGLGISFEGANLSVKLYSSCQYTHHAIHTACELVRLHRVPVEDIARIQVRTNRDEMRVTVVDGQGRTKYEPDSVAAAQFSLPFVIALGLLRGSVFPDVLTEDAIRDPAVLGLARRIDIEESPERNAALEVEGYPPDWITIKTVDGRVFDGMFPHPKGHPQNPASFDDLVDKFNRCCSLVRDAPGEAARSAFLEAVGSLSSAPDCRGLVADLFDVR